MSKPAMNLQDSFLNQVRRENSEVKVLLVNATLLRGTVKGFDNFTLILNNRSGQHLIYKHAIAQIVAHRPHIRPDGSAISAAEETHTDTEESVATEPSAPKPERERKHRPNKSGTQPKSGKEGFNKIDLSQVKIED